MNSIPDLVSWVDGGNRTPSLVRKEMLTRLAKTKLGSHWMIEIPGHEPIPQLEWLRQNHLDSKEVG